MKNKTETIEFFTPKLGLDVNPYVAAQQKQGIHHVGRYQWACEVLKRKSPRRVLDIACGAGYGSFMLAQAIPAAEIIGSDYDERAVAFANGTYKADNLKFRHGNVETWRAGSTKSLGRFDAVTSFDTIEHLPHREMALLRISENLNDDGMLLLSTPCGRQETNFHPMWEHHKLEYSYSDLYKLTKRFFVNVLPPQHPDFIYGEFWRRLNEGTKRYWNRMNPLICSHPIRIPEIAQQYIDV